MSWQAYVDDHLMCEIEGNHLSAAAILGHDGSIWAQSANFPQVHFQSTNLCIIFIILQFICSLHKFYFNWFARSQKLCGSDPYRYCLNLNLDLLSFQCLIVVFWAANSFIWFTDRWCVGYNRFIVSISEVSSPFIQIRRVFRVQSICFK